MALCCPDLSSLVSVSTLPEGGGRADWVDALMVAGDALAKDVEVRPVLEKAPARLVLVSDLRARVGKLGNLGDMLEMLPTALNKLPTAVNKARRCPQPETFNFGLIAVGSTAVARLGWKLGNLEDMLVLLIAALNCGAQQAEGALLS